MNEPFRTSLCSLVVACALLPVQSASAQNDPPPVKVGQAYSTEFLLNKMTFTVLEVLNRSWIKVRLHEGDGVREELGEVVWLNLSNFKVLAEAKPGAKGKNKKAGASIVPSKTKSTDAVVTDRSADELLDFKNKR